MTAHAYGIPRVMAIANGKGGVFKTSCSAAIGGLAAAGGVPTLLVDLDPQGNLTEDLGLAETDEGESTFMALRRGTELRPVSTGRPNLDIVCGGELLDDAAQLLPSRNGGVGTDWQHALADSLAPVAERYDLVILDCPPNTGALTTMALVAARHVLIPTKPDKGSRKGMRRLAKMFAATREHNPELELLGVVLTGVETRATAIRAQAREILTETLDDIAPVLDTVIRHGSGTSFQVREAGRLPHEIEIALSEQTPWWKQLRERAAGGHTVARTEVRLPESAAGVAQDYADLTREVLALLIASEQASTTGGVDA